ncbi:MAG: hypothetical protein ACPG05_02110 [Bdellovibrionales bacterium]
MDRINTHLGWAVMLSQLTHVFCCGLPVVFSVLSLLSGFGLLGMMPESTEIVHEILHSWEMPILLGSGGVLALGWLLHAYARRLDCTKMSSCSHEPCAPKKRKSSYIMIGATVLFAINLFVFVVLEH